MVFLLHADSLDGGVDVDVEWGQQALVDRHRCNLGAGVRPAAGLGDGVGPQGHAAELPGGQVPPWATAALAPQTHGSGEWKWKCRCCDGWRG